MSTRLLILLLGALIGLSPLAIDMYLPSMPSIARELSASPEAVQWTVSIYLIFFALPQLFFGPLSDAMGRRFAIFCGLAFFLGGSILSAVAPNIEVLLVARALQGTGSAAISVTVPALVKDRFSGAEYTRTVGFIMMVMSVAPLVAPIVGGLIFSLGGWRSIFLVLVAITLLLSVLFARAVTESLPGNKRNEMRFGPLLSNYRILFTDRHALGLGICVGFMVAGMMAYIAGSPFVFIEVYGVPPEYYGFLFGLNVFGMMLLTYSNNRLIHFFTNHTLLRASVVLVALATLYLFAITRMEAPPLWMVVLGSVLYVANLGMLSANIQVLLLNRFSHIAGATSAMLGSLRFGVGAFGGIGVSLFHEHSSAPLTGVMAACGLAVVLSYIFAGQPPVDQSPGNGGQLAN
ncbi:Bcr/CflA family multidrug efflux MFS transporter [Gilvimarinus sp. F26214L]|uniref:Bcr/CflA family multidrug efflux MFS transporter n=1 Tax=Gilvimarinus sp. DZF01 TaxID=3461371 RepID=UPI0040459CAE